MRTLSLLLPLLRAAGEDLCGLSSRTTRLWLAGLPPALAAAWVDAHAGVAHDLAAGTPALVEGTVKPLVLTPQQQQQLPVAAAAPSSSAAPEATAAAAVAKPPLKQLPSLCCDLPVQRTLLAALDTYYHGAARALAIENKELRRLEKRADLMLFKKVCR
jgi:hypothetical protein